jgi:hypothetical protein
MIKSLFGLAVAACAAIIAPPATATTFPSLTTIYVGSGVFDSGDANGVGTATTIHCSNVSGVQAQLRVLILGSLGAVVGSLSSPLSHGVTLTVSTHNTAVYGDASLATGAVNQGVVNVESTNSGVFCTAMTVNASLSTVEGVPLHLVRVNPHPGTVE